MKRYLQMPCVIVAADEPDQIVSDMTMEQA